MKKWVMLAVFAALMTFGIGGCGGGAAAGLKPAQQEAVNAKKTFYTQRNMWFGPGKWPGMKVVYTTNYKMGPMIPVNSQVTMEASNKSQISFHWNGNLIILRNMPKHTKTTMAQMMERYFGTKKVDLSRFSKLERDSIKHGYVQTGISKEAVLIARGYPPSHETPDLKADNWKFWKTQSGYYSDTVMVHFEKGKVSRIQE